MGDGGLVDGEEAQGLPVDNPHRDGAALEQQPERLFPAFGFRDVLVCRHPSAVGHRPVDHGDVTPVTQPVDGLVGRVDRYVVEPRLEDRSANLSAHFRWATVCSRIDRKGVPGFVSSSLIS